MCIIVLALMVWIIRHAIKITGSSSIKCTFQYQQNKLCYLQKMEDRFDEGYNSDGGSGTFCDVEDIENAQYFDENDLPDVVLLDAGENCSGHEGN